MAAKLENTPAREGGTALPDPDVELRATTADTIPPTSLKQLFASAGASVYVLSKDPELVDTVRRAGGQHYPVTDVSEWTELELGVQTQRCGIAVLDADLLGAALIARINALGAHSRRVVVLVAAERGVAQTLMNLLSDRKIHRLLIKPPALGITRLLVESAVNRWLQLRELANATGDAELPDTSAPRSKRTPVWLFATAGAALVAGVLAVVMLPSWWRADSPEATSAAPTPTAVDTNAAPQSTETAAVDNVSLPEQPRFADLLARAEQAFGAGRLATPTGDNALDYYLVILAAEPEEPAARTGLGRVIEALFMQAEEALLADRPDAAAAAIEHVRRADPTSSRLAFLDAQLARARVAAAPPARRPSASSRQATVESPPAAGTTSPVANAPSVDVSAELVASARQKLESGDVDTAAVLVAEASRLGASPAQLATLNAGIASARAQRTTQRHEESLALAASRMDLGSLVTPEGDSAFHHLTQLQNEAPDLTGLAAAWNRWRTAVVADVERALEARDWVRAEATITVLQRAPQGDRASEPLLAQLEYGRRQEEYLATAVPATELALIERVPVSYPPQELQRGIEGWVEIEFIVDREGRTRDLNVVAAEPRGRFDQAALTALRQYRYRPFEADGRVFERRVRLRTRFEVQQR